MASGYFAISINRGLGTDAVVLHNPSHRRHVLSGVERTGPPGGGLVCVSPGSRAGRGADRSTRRIGGRTGESAATNLPGSEQRRGLAKSVWQAGNALASREQNLRCGEGDAEANTTKISRGT